MAEQRGPKPSKAITDYCEKHARPEKLRLDEETVKKDKSGVLLALKRAKVLLAASTAVMLIAAGVIIYFVTVYSPLEGTSRGAYFRGMGVVDQLSDPEKREEMQEELDAAVAASGAQTVQEIYAQAQDCFPELMEKMDNIAGDNAGPGDQKMEQAVRTYWGLVRDQMIGRAMDVESAVYEWVFENYVPPGGETANTVDEAIQIVQKRLKSARRQRDLEDVISWDKGLGDLTEDWHY
ncbi:MULTISPECIES: hypothetical protein [unclassified Clostridium]|uniref:hypothetical protein n=1 Tax=unclassified Clostridium TaxID=2614128 RepID=UPI0011067F17|nr:MULTISPECIES: hypothetical protein [unclassified Clostridium]